MAMLNNQRVQDSSTIKSLFYIEIAEPNLMKGPKLQ